MAVALSSGGASEIAARERPDEADYKCVIQNALIRDRIISLYRAHNVTLFVTESEGEGGRGCHMLLSSFRAVFALNPLLPNQVGPGLLFELPALGGHMDIFHRLPNSVISVGPEMVLSG